MGIVAGPNFSFLYGKDKYIEDVTKPFVTVALGINLNYSFTNGWSVMSNVLIDERDGFSDLKFTNQANNQVTTGNSRINYVYLSIPLLINRSFGNKERFFFTFGPSFDFLLLNTESINIGNQFYYYVYGQNSSNYINLSLNTGIGIKVPLSERFNFSLELRNNLGVLNTVQSYNDRGYIRTNSTKLLIGISYKF